MEPSDDVIDRVCGKVVVGEVCAWFWRGYCQVLVINIENNFWVLSQHQVALFSLL